MKENKHLEFLKRIRLSSKENANGRSAQGPQSKQAHNMPKQEEYNLQKELERRFDELFGIASED